MTRLYIIRVKPEHRTARRLKYWRPDGAGYTDDLAQAGVFGAGLGHALRVLHDAESRSEVVMLPDGLTYNGGK